MRGPPRAAVPAAGRRLRRRAFAERKAGRALLRLPRPAPYQHEPPWRPGARGVLSS